MPDINFKVGEQNLMIPREMWFEKVDDTCVAKLMHHPYSKDWTLGLNFFNYYYSVFDYENMQVGLAESNHFGRKIRNTFVKKELKRYNRIFQ